MVDKKRSCGTVCTDSLKEAQEVYEIMNWQDALIAKVLKHTSCAVSYEALTMIIQEFGSLLEQKKKRVK